MNYNLYIWLWMIHTSFSYKGYHLSRKALFGLDQSGLHFRIQLSAYSFYLLGFPVFIVFEELALPWWFLEFTEKSNTCIIMDIKIGPIPYPNLKNWAFCCFFSWWFVKLRISCSTSWIVVLFRGWVLRCSSRRSGSEEYHFVLPPP